MLTSWQTQTRACKEILVSNWSLYYQRTLTMNQCYFPAELVTPVWVYIQCTFRAVEGAGYVINIILSVTYQITLQENKPSEKWYKARFEGVPSVKLFWVIGAWEGLRSRDWFVLGVHFLFNLYLKYSQFQIDAIFGCFDLVCNVSILLKWSHNGCNGVFYFGDLINDMTTEYNVVI